MAYYDRVDVRMSIRRHWAPRCHRTLCTQNEHMAYNATQTYTSPIRPSDILIIPSVDITCTPALRMILALACCGLSRFEVLIDLYIKKYDGVLMGLRVLCSGSYGLWSVNGHKAYLLALLGIFVEDLRGGTQLWQA